jgi:polyphosphate kinase
VKIPDVFPTWIRVDPNSDTSPDKSAPFISLHRLIERNLPLLFPGMDVVGVTVFRVTRNADIERDEEDADDLLEMIEEELRLRRFAKAVRLEYGPNPNPLIVDLLKSELELNDHDLYEYSIPLDELDLRALTELKRPELQAPPTVPVIPAPLLDEEADLFSLIRKNDFLVHHPYESFTATVEKFISAAASDPRVIAIKMIIYRTGEDSPFIPFLIRAAEAGKQVVCLVELKARFDEAKNILVAQELERAGVHVVYGVVGLKTHGKVALVVRQEQDGVRCYAHIGTGNYNAQTARVYTDLGLFTAKPELTDDVVHVFHYLTGRSLYSKYKKLLVAPVKLKENFLRMIENEVSAHKAGKPARIIAKMNSLEDKEICRALYRASQEGVKIDLIVRGFCCLRPQVPGMSENIRVISVIGQLLEHSRIFYFQNGENNPVHGNFYMGSADWMHRNLSARVEVVAPIEDPALKHRCWEILTLMLEDQRQAWDMQPDGSYIQRHGHGNAGKIGVQTRLAQLARGH